MKRALIIDITHGFGLHTAIALLANGWHLRTLMRDPACLFSWMRGVKVVVGDVSRIDDVRLAAEGMDAIVYGADISCLRRAEEALPLLEPSVCAAEALGLTLVFPGDIYGYVPNDATEFDERRPPRPISRKSSVRQRMEQRLEVASRRGARIILLRTGAFIGAHGGSSWLKLLLKRTRRGYRLLYPGTAEHVHTWANLPDVGRTVSALLRQRETLPSHAVFHFNGYRASFTQLAEIVNRVSGKPVTLRPLARGLPWPFARLVPLPHDVQEMSCLWEREINMNGDRLRARLNGKAPWTPLPEALIAAGVVDGEVERRLHWSYVREAP